MSAHPRLTAEFAVAPDGRGVLFAARDTNALWWLPIGDDGVTAGEPRPTALPVTGPSLASIAVSPDGRRDRVDRGRVDQQHLGHRRRARAGARRHAARAFDRHRLARRASRGRRGRAHRVHGQSRQRRQQDLPRGSGAAAAPADDRRARSLQPVLAARRERAGRAGQPRRRHGLVAARVGDRSRAAPVPAEPDREAAWRPGAGRRARGRDGDQQRPPASRGRVRARRRAEPVDDDAGPARPDGAARPAHVRDHQRRVRGVVSGRGVAGVPVRPRWRHAAVRGRRRWPGAGAAAHVHARHQLHRRVDRRRRDPVRRQGSARSGTSAAWPARPGRSPR